MSGVVRKCVGVTVHKELEGVAVGLGILTASRKLELDLIGQKGGGRFLEEPP